MKNLVRDGVAIAAIMFGSSSMAQAVDTASSVAPVKASVRKNFFNSNQARADVSPRLQKMFAALDLNHDGLIARDELKTSQTAFDQRMAQSAPRRAARLFERLDTNKDGRITQAEIDARRAARTPSANPSKRRGGSTLIRQADANQDGIVTRAEFDTAVASGKLKPHQPRMLGNMIATMFDTADGNHDGRLTLQEAEQAALQRFDAADTNRDGLVTPDERRQAARAARAHKRSG